LHYPISPTVIELEDDGSSRRDREVGLASGNAPTGCTNSVPRTEHSRGRRRLAETCPKKKIGSSTDNVQDIIESVMQYTRSNLAIMSADIDVPCTHTYPLPEMVDMICLSPPGGAQQQEY
jgi:hypothetical protein